ncbi:MAG: helix-turn-helix transcriptional regulator [Rhodospirillaceae bacterium]|jgi:XRE family transcriptional regulator, aerobic/anaerobic benzoate catabolism transcriptional regulator|nr:helix-turn-helix transcriptional regulator [Rhodospirillaceae bacterium]MBT6117133.1 helix-turn-helix transcriptional regulator [Rhodospirillaceae bacterium]
MVAQPLLASRPSAVADGALAAGEGDFLAGLGARVRALRARRGMSRRLLARDSGVSERYLAQLESGRGNISVARLRAVAAALGIALDRLIREGTDRPAEFDRMVDRLAELDGPALTEAAHLLDRHFGRAVAGGRGGRIALIGLRGAGKSTLGSALGAALGVPFIELAAEIEVDSGMSLPEIFNLSGHAAYRRYERRALDRVLADRSAAVIATGGGIVSEPATFDRLLGGCFTVWLRCAPEAHMARVVAQGDTRPMAGNPEAMDDLKRILGERETLYGQADLTVETTDKSVEESLAELVRSVQAVRGAVQAP